MKLTYVAHASLLMETGNLKVVTDPWFNGPAYLNQWHVFPKPVDTSFSEDATHIILTHAHEDHLHVPTLKLMNKDAEVFFPFTWKNGTKELLQSIGFKKIHEVSSFKKITLSDQFCMTFIVNGLDAFVVYESDGKVSVNLNDALNASHWAFVEIFTKMIRSRWKQVDLLICGLGGASYFPNTVHATGKDDYEIALLREQFLAHKCCEIVEEIKPVAIFPFVPGFALLENDKQWINKMKFSRNNLEKYYKDFFDKNSTMQFFALLPGDSIENNHWNKTSPYHQHVIDDNLSHLLHQQYAKEIVEANQHLVHPVSIVQDLKKGLQNILSISSRGIAEELLQQINFSISFKDVMESSFIHCFYEKGKVKTNVVSEIPENSNLTIETYSYRLRHAINELWGGDVFYIGYGADIYITDDTCLMDNIDIVSLRLLSRFPSASHTMMREPVRAARYMTANPTYAYLAIKQKIQMRGNMNKLPYNERSHWINKGRCDVCLLCDLPLLSDDFGELLKPQSKKPFPIATSRVRS